MMRVGVDDSDARIFDILGLRGKVLSPDKYYTWLGPGFLLPTPHHIFLSLSTNTTSSIRSCGPVRPRNHLREVIEASLDITANSVGVNQVAR